MNEMTEYNDLKKLEKKAVALYFQDGLWDITLGFILISFGIAMSVYDLLPSPLNSLLGLLLTFVAIGIFWLAKRFLVLPRVGIAKTRQKRKKQMIVLAIITAMFVVLTIIAVILTVTGVLNFGSLGIGTAIIFGLIPLVIFGGIASLFSYYRIFINGVAFSIGIFLNELFYQLGYPLYGHISLIIAGVAVVIMGVVLLILFLRKYPLVRGEEIGL